MAWQEIPVAAACKILAPPISAVATSVAVIVGQNVPPPPNAKTVADWLPWLVGSGGLVWLGGQLRKFLIETKRDLRAVDEGTNYQQLQTCKAELATARSDFDRVRAGIDKDLERVKNDLAHCYLQIASKDSLYDRLDERYQSLFARYTELADRVATTNSNLSQKRPKADQPLAVSIDARSEPVPVTFAPAPAGGDS
jgi:hypothetical protein